MCIGCHYIFNNRREEMTGDITTELTEKRGIKFYLTITSSFSVLAYSAIAVLPCGRVFDHVL